MKTPTILAAAAFAISALALGSRLLEPSASPRDFDGSAALAAGPRADLAARLDALVEENRELRARLATLELRPVSTERLPVAEDADEFASREDLERLRDELLAVLERRAAVGHAPLGHPEALRAQVADALSEIRRSESVEKALGGLERRTMALDETMPRIESWLSLTPSQSHAMRAALLDRFAREADLLRRWEAGEDPAVIGEIKASDHELHQTELASFLSVQQLQAYQSRSGGGK